MNLQGATLGWWQERRLAGALAVSLLLHGLLLLPASWARLAPFVAQRLDVSLRPAQPAPRASTSAAALGRAAPERTDTAAKRRLAMASAVAPARAQAVAAASDATPGVAAGAAARITTLSAAVGGEGATRPPAAAGDSPAAAAARAEPARQADDAEPGPDPGAVARYRFAVARAVVKRYPPLAIERGLEGVAHVRLAMGGGALPPRVTVAASSGHAVLDAEAREMIRRAAERAVIPEPLRGRAFAIDLPVRFDLAETPDG